MSNLRLSKCPEASRSKAQTSIRTLSILAALLGIALIISWNFKLPVLIQVYPNWVPMQSNSVLNFSLAVMGTLLVLFACLSFSMWRKRKSLDKKLEEETGRRKAVERNLVRTQEVSKSGNWVLELSGHEMWWSNEIYRILDCNPKITTTNLHRFITFVHPGDRSFVRKEIQKALHQGTALNITHRIIHKDGSIRIVKHCSETYLDPKGKFSQIFGTIQDVTNQRKAENLVTCLERIVDKSFNEIYIIDAETFKFTKANLAARLNLRYKMEELRRMTPVDLLPEFKQKQFVKMTSALRRGIESVTAFETIHVRKTGTHYPVDIRLKLSSTETRTQFVAIIQDITNRKKVETLMIQSHQNLDKQVHERTSNLMKLSKDLRLKIEGQKKTIDMLGASEHRLIEIMNHIADGIIVFDAKGIMLSFNRAAESLFGFKVEEALGENIDILIAGPNGKSRDGFFKELLRSQKSDALRLRRMITARKKNGTTFSVELEVNEHIVGDQKTFTALIRECTEKEGIDQEMKQFL
jgi:PAS domain S-box-containing protein